MNWFFGANETNEVENKEVENTVQKISSSTLLDDRLEGIQKLSDLSSEEQYHKDFGEETLKVVFEQLKLQHENVDVVKQLILIILNLEKNENFMKHILKIEYIRGIVMLLDLNEEYIKYHSVQLLTSLLKRDVETVQQGILSEPIGVARLVDLMTHVEEIIRNECLLLMNNLTKGGSQEILKIIAFEGAFEKLLNILNEEGGNTGGIIVQDCILILNNLLNNNPSNQAHFQLLGCIPYLKSLIYIQKSKEYSKRNQEIIYSSLGIFHHLSNNDDAKNQIVKSDLLNDIIILALSKNIPTFISIEALNVLGDLIYKNKIGQESLLAYNFEEENDGYIQSAVVSLCKIILFETEEFQLAGFECLKKFLNSNKEGQLFIASTVKAPTLIKSIQEEGMLCGITISNALFGYLKPKKVKLESISFFASKILSLIIRQSSKCKEILLEIPYEIKSTNVSFFQCLIKSTIHSIKSKVNEKISCGLLKLLCEWISNSSESSNRFFENTDHFLYFIEVVNSNEMSINIRGLSSILIGLLAIEYKDEQESIPGSYTKENIYDALITRVGIEKFEERWNEFSSSLDFVSAKSQSQIQSQSQQQSQIQTQIDQFLNNFDKEFIEFTIESTKNIRNFLSIKIAKSKPKEPEIDFKKEYQNLQKNSSDEIEELKLKKEKDELFIHKLNERIEEFESKIKILNSQHSSILEENQYYLNQIEKYQDEMKDFTSLQKLSENMLQEKQKEISNLKLKIDEFKNENEDIELLKEKIKNLNENDSLIKNEKDQLNLEIKNLKNELKIKEESLIQKEENQKINLHLKNEEIEKLKIEKVSIQESFQENLKKIENKQQEIIKKLNLEKQQEINQINQNLKNEKEELKNKLKLKQNEIEELILKLNQKEMELSKSLEDESQLKIKMENKIQSMQTEMENMKKQIETQTQSQNTMTTPQTQTQTQNLPPLMSNQMPKNLFSNSSDDQLIQTLKSKVVELENSIHEKDSQISELERDNEDMMDLIEKLEKKYEK
eukprot:gene10789-3406_t